MGSVTGSKSKDKKVSEGIAAGFGDMTDDQAADADKEKQSEAAKHLMEPTMWDSAADLLGISKKKK